MSTMTRAGQIRRRRYHALAVKLLAEGALRQGEIAEKCEVHQSTISEFAKQFADEIQRVRDSANVQLSSLWIADQVARMETFQEAAEKLIELAESDLPQKFDVKGSPLIGSDGRPVLDAAGRIEALRELRATLRSVADELGQSKPKLELDGQTLRVEIVGVDLTNL
jgi:DNA-binding MarR family transcriptional regulator